MDGDRIIALSAIRLHETGRVEERCRRRDRDGEPRIPTLLSRSVGSRSFTAPVGDKFVVEAMSERGAVLGGEQSGHIIFSEHATTGDGILDRLEGRRDRGHVADDRCPGSRTSSSRSLRS